MPGPLDCTADLVQFQPPAIEILCPSGVQHCMLRLKQRQTYQVSFYWILASIDFQFIWGLVILDGEKHEFAIQILTTMHIAPTCKDSVKCHYNQKDEGTRKKKEHYS
eukprot:1148251-Pelagomonas_calceolata.AAC.6